MTDVAVAIVRDWHEALNAGDIDRLIALSTEDVEVGGPRGSGRGAALLREWFGRAGIRLTPRQIFHRDDLVVVEQEAEWRSPDAAAVTSQQTPASVFVVRAGRIASVTRHPDLTGALAAAGLSQADHV